MDPLEGHNGGFRMTNKTWEIYIISDAVGETAQKVIQASLAQFPDLSYQIHLYPFIRTTVEVSRVLDVARENMGIVIHTLVVDNLAEQTDRYCQKYHLVCFNILQPIVKELAQVTQAEPTGVPGATHEMNAEYFNRINCMEFAVKYDDGKDPAGFLKADVVLLGVSRTSKTPLSMFLANKNVKVANLPIYPKVRIPDELWQVDPKRIVGLTNDVKVLNSFRKERLITYGLDPDTPYSELDNIRQELAYCYDLYRKLNCMVINVSKRSIEETAVLITDYLKRNTLLASEAL